MDAFADFWHIVWPVLAVAAVYRVGLALVVKLWRDVMGSL